jgi:hypothetical protein
MAVQLDEPASQASVVWGWFLVSREKACGDEHMSIGWLKRDNN